MRAELWRKRDCMQGLFFKLNHFAKRLMTEQDGQDTTEYALVFSLVSFGAVSGMGSVAASVNLVFLDTASVFLHALGY